MTPTTNSQPELPARLECALKNAVVKSWDELMPDSKSGLIHIEYETGRDGSLDFLTIWTSTVRGYWSLVCELWMHPLWSHVTGLSFHNDYHSVGFARGLELVTEHQNDYSKLPGRRGVIQVYPPQEEAKSLAEAVHNNLNPIPTEELLAA